MRKIIRLLLISLFIVSTIKANIINVPSEQPTIQSAIDAVNNGDTILVQPGTYLENINYNGKNIVVGSLFLTTGDTTYISQTIIDGNNSGSVVVFKNNENSSAIIKGFTITNGAANNGGGIHCQNASPKILNCVISNNNCSNGGGGIVCYNSSLYIENSIIKENYSGNFGGGIYVDLGHLIMKKCSVIGNSAPFNEGGGVYLNPGSCEIYNSLILNNYTEVTGAGLCFESGSNYKIVNCTIHGNRSLDAEGAAVSVIYDAHAIFTNCIFTNNTGNSAFVEKFGEDDCSITLENCNTFNNSPDGSINIIRNNIN